MYTPDEIKKIAADYRGKPEKFDPMKGVMKREGPLPTRKNVPSSKELPLPNALNRAKTPTPRKNTPLWTDSILWIDVSVRVKCNPRGYSDLRPFLRDYGRSVGRHCWRRHKSK